MSTMAVIWVSLFCLGSIFPQRVLGIDLSFSILASFWLHGLHFTACSCSSWNGASCFISTCTSSGSSTLAVDSFNWLPVELSGTLNPWREGTGNWRCRHSWIKHKWYLSCTHNPWREGTGGADTAQIKHKWCGIRFISWTSCPSFVVHHTYVATESKQFLCTYMDLWWSEAASDGTKMREHSRQSCWSNHFCSPKWTTLELEGKQFSTEEGIALASFSLYLAVLCISKLLYLCRDLANLPEEEPSVAAVPSPSWTTLPYAAGAASHPQAGTTSSCRQSLTLLTLPLCFMSHLAPLECSSSYAKYDTKLWKINVHICIQEMHTISKQIYSCTLWWFLFCALSQSVQLTFILNCIQRSWGAWRCADLLQHGNLINSALCLLEDFVAQNKALQAWCQRLLPENCQSKSQS